MDSKRGISFQWRMFVPEVVMFWIIIVAMATWQIMRVGELNRNIIYEQLKLIASRIVALYDTDEEFNTNLTLAFINNYYEASLDYDPMRVMVFKPEDGTIVNNVGNVERFNRSEIRLNYPGLIQVKREGVKSDQETYKFLYYAVPAENDSLTVCVLLPYTGKLARIISPATTRFWLFFLAIAVLATLMAYLSTHFLSRNIRMLRDFAHNAANDPNFISTNTADFPHDEMGDISRQILSIYNQRVAEMQRREREHSVALTAIEEKNRIKRELTGNINHELKTPVAVIKGYIDTIIDNPDMDVETRDKFLYKAQENVHRLSNLISDITDITRLENGDKLVNVSEVDFHDVVFAFDNMLQETGLLQGKLVFEYDIPLPCLVLANEGLLHSVILNLTKNAVAYSNGTICRLECVGEDEEFYYFQYYDDGIGVAPEHLPHMFERFYRVDSGRTRETGGTGLGLPIVEVAIKSFGGTISVSNRHPSGLVFDFTLPKWHRS